MTELSRKAALMNVIPLGFHIPAPFCFAGLFHAVPDKARVRSGVCGFLPLSGTPGTISGSFPSLLSAEGFVSRLKENSDRWPRRHGIVMDDRGARDEAPPSVSLVL